MRNLALLLNALGNQVSGSDREFDHGHLTNLKQEFLRQGILIYPQDGTGITPNLDEVIVSTAVESTVPDIVQARAAGLQITHRADLMARMVNQGPGIAVAGTSGKTTITAMLAHVLANTAYDPWVVCGGELLDTQGSTLPGYRTGRSDWWCYETDESDKSILKYKPQIGIISSLSKDHMSVEELIVVFTQFAEACQRLIVHREVSDQYLQEVSARKNALLYSCTGAADVVGTNYRATAWGSAFTVDGVEYTLTIPGWYNVANALAVIACCRLLAVDPLVVRTSLATFPGVRRRFQLLGEKDGIKVVDDFAHNPDKIAASLAAARSRSSRILAVFQPHGFGPLRLMLPELTDSFVKGLSKTDKLFVAPVFFAGGTVVRDISSRDLVEAVKARGLNAVAPETRHQILTELASLAHPGDLILIMGARDDTLTAFGKTIVEQL